MKGRISILTTNADINFVESFNAIQKQVHQTAVEKGFWDADDPEATKIALMHSELSEALEALRKGTPPDDKVPEFSGVEAEYADTIIRIMDVAERKGYRIAEAILSKAQMNTTRPYMNGGKAF